VMNVLECGISNLCTRWPVVIKCVVSVR